MLHLFPHWNWEGMEGKTIAVWVYSNLDKVELLHNGQSLGTKEMKKDGHVAWVVKYAPGSIEARGYKGDKVAMTTKRETTGAAAKLVIRPTGRRFRRTERMWRCSRSKCGTRKTALCPLPTTRSRSRCPAKEN